MISKDTVIEELNFFPMKWQALLIKVQKPKLRLVGEEMLEGKVARFSKNLALQQVMNQKNIRILKFPSLHQNNLS
jgi:hypothetical protein